MTALEVSVSQDSLTVDTCDTLKTMLDGADGPWGRRLHDALVLAMSCTNEAYVTSPYVRATDVDFRSDTADRRAVGDTDVTGVLANMQKAGYVKVRAVLSESPTDNYLTDGRQVTEVHVLKPFTVVSVRYWFSPATDRDAIVHGYASAYRWEITDRSYIVPAGWYLVAEAGFFATELYGVAEIREHIDGDLCWLFDIEGFDASRCFAGCDACGSRWAADSGSWRFEPDYCDARPWAFDDATDFDAESNTIACPACCLGRVGFDIY